MSERVFLSQRSPEIGKRYKSTFAYYSAFVGLGLISAVLGSTLPALAE
ncbi:MAG: hypothetical protein ISS57_04445 [Anaerolineales bacterium]|nr:hypothetical protein [Chloroflexota bacterium]MBL7161833.1 hypothetical protein [Anaerolineales bacterium]